MCRCAYRPADRHVYGPCRFLHAAYSLMLMCRIWLQGLPVRGQKTKTNARTRKGKPKAIAGKKIARK